MLKQIFKELGLSNTSYRIYNELLENGASSARTLANNLGMPRPSVYDHLKILLQKGLIIEHNKENKKIFDIDSPEKIPQIIKERVSILEEERKKIEELLPTLRSKTQSVEPKIKSYSGPEGIKEILKDMLWHENIETTTMWPISEMVSILGENYLADLNRKRIRQNISIRGIWPHNKKVDLKSYPFLGVGGGHLRELRVAPKEMDWNMSYWQYGDKVAFISSRKETFGFVVNSRDFVGLMKAQFEVIWKMSKPVTPQRKYTDVFLETI